jgi:hypothetical protein
MVENKHDQGFSGCLNVVQSSTTFDHTTMYTENATSHAARFLTALKPREFFALVRKHRPWFAPVQAAAYLRLSVRTLESWRAKGIGPQYRGRGKNIRYHIDALDAVMTHEE